jgi:hypothetical protein
MHLTVLGNCQGAAANLLRTNSDGSRLVTKKCDDFGLKLFEELTARFGELYSQEQFRCIAQLDVIRAVEAAIEAGYEIETKPEHG